MKGILHDTIVYQYDPSCITALTMPFKIAAGFHVL